MSNAIKHRLVYLDNQIKYNKQAYLTSKQNNTKRSPAVKNLLVQRQNLLEDFNKLTQSITNTPITTAKPHVTVGNYFQNQAKN